MRKITTILMILFTAGLLAGCGDNGAGPDPEPDPRLEFAGEYETESYDLTQTSSINTTTVTVSSSIKIVTALVEGSDSEITLYGLELFIEEGIAALLGFNFDVTLNKEAMAEVSTGTFVLEETDFTLNGNINGTIDGEGTLENGVLTFSFEYRYPDNQGGEFVFSGEVALEEMEAL